MDTNKQIESFRIISKDITKLRIKLLRFISEFLGNKRYKFKNELYVSIDESTRIYIVAVTSTEVITDTLQEYDLGELDTDTLLDISTAIFNSGHRYMKDKK